MKGDIETLICIVVTIAVMAFAGIMLVIGIMTRGDQGHTMIGIGVALLFITLISVLARLVYDVVKRRQQERARRVGSIREVGFANGAVDDIEPSLLAALSRTELPPRLVIVFLLTVDYMHS